MSGGVDTDRRIQHRRDDAHEQIALPRESAGCDEPVDRHTSLPQRIHDPSQSKRRRLQRRTVQVLRPVVQLQPGECTLQTSVHQWRTAPVEPVETEHVTGAGLLSVAVLGNNELGLEGYAFGVDFDGTALDVVEVTDQGTAAEGAGFFAPALNNDPGPGGGYWTLGVVIDIQGPGAIPPGSDHVLALASYQIDPGVPAGTILDLMLRDDLGPPPVPITFVEVGGQVTPGALDGSITVGDVVFIRGDVDFDGLFNGLTDALYLLNYGFLRGDPPPCLDAADADDSGDVNALTDSLVILAHQFSGGPPPPPPYPDPGVDPTPDPLGC